MNESMKRLAVIAEEIDTWGSKNFPIKLPAWGVLEEIGEMTHCLLKRQQKIRGFDKKEHFEKEFADAIADAAIYLLHDAFMQSVHVFDDIDIENEDYNLNNPGQCSEFLAGLAENCSILLGDMDHGRRSKGIHDDILMDLAVAADFIGREVPELVEETWAKVKQRNWEKNRETAHLDAEAPAFKPLTDITVTATSR